jgi:hypothetical protein
MIARVNVLLEVILELVQCLLLLPFEVNPLMTVEILTNSRRNYPTDAHHY